MQSDTIISHIRPTDLAVQTNDEHSKGVADLAATFAAEFGMHKVGYVMGLLHDKGKEQHGFQQYIKSVSGYDPSVTYAEKTPHAFVGMLVALKIASPYFALIGMPIAAHHAGLYDWNDFQSLLAKPLPSDVTIEKIPDITPIHIKAEPNDVNHIIRMLYSVLVDADFLDTEHFMQPERSAERRPSTDLMQLHQKLEDYLKLLSIKASDTPVNNIRNQVQQVCREQAASAPGFYSLTVPTGGGKTLSSLVWAVNHAILHGKRRIIIAIPYTSIIIQTAEILRKIFGEENVLEHHSAMNITDCSESSLNYSQRLATENWDSPIVVTTNVQLFESIFASKPSKCRKLHNICNSVVILDEVQALPIDHLQPIVDALKTYQRHFGISVLFTTASMPALKGNYRGCSQQVILKGIDNITEIIPKTMNLHDSLRRVSLKFDAEASDYDQIASRLIAHPRVLCIVNTRHDAQEIFSRLPDEGITIHLSKMMCPAHIRYEIKRLKDALKSPEQNIIRVVATQLIEAGVDIDFPIVYRQEAGLDSILQAAGRCNREGHLSISPTYIFSLTKEHPLPSGHLSNTANACKNLKITDGTDCFASETMLDYFKQLYCRTQTFDAGPNNSKSFVSGMLYKPHNMCFDTIGQQFRLISDDSINVIVNWCESDNLVTRLKNKEFSASLMKAISQYSVQVRERDFSLLRQAGLVEEIMEGIWYIPYAKQYDEKTGLTYNNSWLEEILIK